MKPDWDWVATGPGIGIQLTRGKHAGRLVIPSDHKRTLAGKQLEWNSHMMFSDDGGATWQISAPISAGGNECQVIERTDGSLLVNTRMQGGWEGWRGIAPALQQPASARAEVRKAQRRARAPHHPQQHGRRQDLANVAHIERRPVRLFQPRTSAGRHSALPL
jgi:hypothetical protein